MSDTCATVRTPCSASSCSAAARGSWTISSNQATTASAANTYPIATVTGASSAQTLNADVGVGTGIAFWVTDANNWWGVYRQETNFSYDCSFTSYYDCSYQYWVSGQWCRLLDPNCNEWCEDICDYWSYPVYVGQTCSQYVSQTCQGTNRFLTMIKSVAGTVSTVVQAAASAAIASIRLTITGSSGVAVGYSTTAQTTSVATTTQTLSGPALSSGLILAPSDNASVAATRFTLTA